MAEPEDSDVKIDAILAVVVADPDESSFENVRPAPIPLVAEEEAMWVMFSMSTRLELFESVIDPDNTGVVANELGAKDEKLPIPVEKNPPIPILRELLYILFPTIRLSLILMLPASTLPANRAGVSIPFTVSTYVSEFKPA